MARLTRSHPMNLCKPMIRPARIAREKKTTIVLTVRFRIKRCTKHEHWTTVYGVIYDAIVHLVCINKHIDTWNLLRVRSRVRSPFLFVQINCMLFSPFWADSPNPVIHLRAQPKDLKLRFDNDAGHLKQISQTEKRRKKKQFSSSTSAEISFQMT